MDENRAAASRGRDGVGTVGPDDARDEECGERGVIGEWDSDRLTRVASNLVANARMRGGTGSVVRVAVDGKDGAEVVLRVHNDGPRIHAMKLR